jgi:hypothetical protein
LPKAEYSEPTDLAEAGYSEVVDSGDDLAQATQHPIIDYDEPYEDLDVAAEGDSVNSAYGGQAQVASDDSTNSAHDGIGNQVKLLMYNS